MTGRVRTGLFVAEGTSDLPLAGIVESLFLERGVSLRVSRPDFALLPKKVRKDVASRVRAGIELIGKTPDVIIVHRDADNCGPGKRRDEIKDGVGAIALDSEVIPVVPVRMTEAWLLLDESAIRVVAGNPKGRIDLRLPRVNEVESRADPKSLLAECLIRAADVTGRRRRTVDERFSNHRRQLFERLDPTGPVSQLPSWQALLTDIDEVARRWLADS